MPENTYLVFSTPPEGMSAEEYGSWYQGHLADILRVEGFDAARRFNLEAQRGDTAPTMYPHLAFYVISGEPHETLERLGPAMADGSIPMPDWWGGVRFASFYAYGLEGPIDLDALDHMYAVFSRQPAGMGLDEYLDWYHTHARENCTATGFERAWRYRLERDAVDERAPCESVHAAFYEVHGEMPELRAALKEAADAGRVGFPDWFGDILFASMEGRAAGPVVAGVGV